MPLIKIEILKGKSDLYKETLCGAVNDAVVTVLGIDPGVNFQRLCEAENGFYGKNAGKEGFCIIEINMYPGRDAEVKKRLMNEIIRLLDERLNIDKADIFILINDPPFENWCFGGTIK